MPRNSSGVYTLPSGNPVVPGTTIDAAWANDTMEDMANEITNSLSRTGAGGMLAPFRIADGNVTAPGLSYLNETNTGLYRSGAGSTWMSVLGVNVAQFSTVGVTIPSGKSLTAQGATYLTSTLAVTGATTIASTLAVTGAITAIGGVIGNVTGNVTAASGTSAFNNVTISGNLDMDAGSSATIINLPNPTNSGDAANKGYVDTQVATRLALTGGTMTGVIAMSNNKVTGLATPTADQDAATKAYVDSVAQGLDAKASCRASTTANITLSGAQTIDGVAIIAGDRVLVQNQSSAAQNGIYVAAAGAWARSSDANTWDSLVAAYTFIEQGTVNGNNGYICTIAPGGTLGTTPVTWAQFSGAGQITAGTGMSKTGNTLNVNTASSSRIVVGADDIDLATTGVTASIYKSVTVDAYGRVTGGTNPTTLAGYGISDAYTTSQVDSALALKLNLTGGTMSGVIAMGANKITGLADPTLAQDAATKNYIDTIFGSTSSAAASASAAASSASSASSSATAAASSATAAAGSATSASTTYTNFNNQYLGSKSSDPTVNNTGGALVAGNLYWNSTASEMRVYSGSAWVAAYLPAAGYLALTGGTLTGSLGFNGNGLRITGDFSNATLTNRLMFQTSTTNGNTGVYFIPNGTSQISTFRLANNSDPTNAAHAQLQVNSAEVSLVSGITGSGTYLPLAFSTGGAERGRVTTTGNWLIGSTTDDATNKLQITGSATVSGSASIQGLTVGRGAGAVATNVALGTNALQGSNSGNGNNIAIGYEAGRNNTTGAYNTWVGGLDYSGGLAVGRNNTTGQYNSGFGAGALANNTTASNNTAVGYQAGYSNTTGSTLDAFGALSLKSNTTGTDNCAFGTETMNKNTTGVSNAAFGRLGLYQNTTGGYNTAVGTSALQNNTTASYNTAAGYQAGYSNTTGSSLTCLGYYAGRGSTGDGNTAIGSEAYNTASTGGQNTIMGNVAGAVMTSGSYNTAIGSASLRFNTTAGNNTAVGYQSIYTNTTGTDNTAIGRQTLYSNTTGYSNTALGIYALYSNTTAINNTAVGRDAGYSNTTGTGNTFIGKSSGGNNTTGNNNTCLGIDAGGNVAAAGESVCLGRAAGFGLVATGTLYIAHDNVGAGNANCWIYGNSSGACYQGNNSSSWSTTSDERLKNVLGSSTKGLAEIMQVEVKNFKYKAKDDLPAFVFNEQGNAVFAPDSENIYTGPIAQQVQTPFPEAVKTGEMGVLTVDSDPIFWAMLNAIKELKAEVDSLKSQLKGA